MKLIAQVPTKIMVDGEVRLIQPGEELPDVNAHDATELVTAGAAVDPKTVAAQEKSAVKSDAARAADFQTIRAAVKAAEASLSDGADAAKAPQDESPKA